MRDDDRWNADDQAGESVFGIAGMGILRFTLLFGSAAVALALVLAPIADSQSRQFAGAGETNVDRMSTGSVPAGNRYTVRKSVLQDSPTSICVIYDNGQRSGKCN